ncbi:MAG TPA: MarR family winged helix-turn-helix transcriptional regulator [Pseudonocardia sp.]|nr:MarR family winged helix-turn-helix transcriptional regulator [Pseudonocardia sp.]
MSDPLTAEERAAWRSVLLAADVLRFRVSAEIRPRTGLSPAEHVVLIRLSQSPGRSMGQQHLADELFWSKSRLSRQLSRMQARGLVSRGSDGLAAGVQVELTDAGREAVEAAAPVLADAVRRHLISAASEEELAAIVRLADRLLADARHEKS